MQTYFGNKNKTNFQKLLLSTTKRVIKSTVAVLSLWFPSIFNLVVGKGQVEDPANYVYTNILDKLTGQQIGDLENVGQKSTRLAEIVITPDQMTTGFLEDSQLII